MNTDTAVIQRVAIIDGQQVPLTECHWLQFAPCGCPCAITVAELASGGHVVADADAAALTFTSSETKAEVERDRKAGYTIRLVTHKDYQDVWCEKFKASCPHEPKWGYIPTPIPDGYEWGAGSDFPRRTPYKHLVPVNAICRDGEPYPKLDDAEAGKALCGSGSKYAVWRTDWHRRDGKMECSRCVKAAIRSVEVQGGAS